MLLAIEHPVFYLGKYHHLTAKRRPLNWFNRPWLPDIYKDNSDQKVIVKAARLGISEYLYCDMMYCGMLSLNGMDILPTEPIRNRVVKGRIERIIGNTKLYRDNCGTDVDSASIKTLFSGVWNFVGSNSPATFHEFDSDINIYDEFDQCDQNNIALARQRTGASEKNRWIIVGNPTLSGFGIDLEYQQSDQKVWLLKCPHCIKEQQLDWFKNFVDRKDDGSYFLRCTCNSASFNTGTDASAVCQYCNGLIDRLMPGEWVAQNPGSPISGYHCDKLFGRPGNDGVEERPIIREMFASFVKAQSNQTALQIFYNQELGLPYTAEGSHISLSVLEGCKSDYGMPLILKRGEVWGQTVAGMDVGGTHHLHISRLINDPNGRQIRQKVFIGSVPSWDEADRICRVFGVRRGVVDARPELHMAREWVSNHAGWFLCEYIAQDKAKENKKPDYVKKVIQVNRTESLDASFAQYQNKEVQLPINFKTLDNGEFVRQMGAATRRFEPDKDGGLTGRYIWDEAGKPDHHQHADNYERIAADLNISTGMMLSVS